MSTIWDSIRLSRRFADRKSIAVGFGLLSTVLTAACGLPDNEGLGEIESEVSVGTYTSGTCSTSVVLGLSTQIADEMGCLSSGTLVKFSPSAKLQITSSAVLPYLHGTAKTDLEKVTANTTIQVNSAFRTVAQQYLLVAWHNAGRCGITAAAPAGRSNHESGRALDVSNYSSVIGTMANRGWAHDVPGDPVHFDHLSSPDNRGKDVLAFQRLWNRNHPTDKISEDGAYGPQTEARLRMAPATGFPVGATCPGAARTAAANVVMIDGPDKVAPGTKTTFAITVDNSGELDWPSTTKVVVSGGDTSQMYDAAKWVSPKEVGTIGVGVPAGSRGVVEISVAAPNVTEETPLFTQFALEDNGQTIGTINLGVTVTPNGDEGTSGDADDEHDESDQVTGGCNASGGGSWTALLIPALLVLRRRRRLR